MSRRSAAAVARSRATGRIVATLVALLALTSGVAVLLVGTGVVGPGLARRAVLDPAVAGWVSGHRPLVLGAAVAVGLLLAGLGLWGAFRSVRAEPAPDLVLTPSLTVTADALSDAVRADVEALPDVARTRVRLVGDTTDPAMRIILWLREGADLRTVWGELDRRVLARARQALGVSALPTAVRIELDAARRQRVR